MSKSKTSIKLIILITTSTRKSSKIILVIIIKRKLRFQESKRNKLARLTR
jgi:hypothetical protein